MCQEVKMHESWKPVAGKGLCNLSMKVTKNIKAVLRASMKPFLKSFIFCRSSNTSECKESDEEIYRSVYRDYRRELRISKSKHEKVTKYINEIFVALAKYDTRFEFDPMSIDDHRFEVISDNELRVTCQLINFSKRNFEVDGNASEGRVQIRLVADANG